MTLYGGPGEGVLGHVRCLLSCSPHLHFPCSFSFSFPLWLQVVDVASVSCWHLGEAVEPLCLLTACSRA